MTGKFYMNLFDSYVISSDTCSDWIAAGIIYSILYCKWVNIEVFKSRNGWNYYKYCMCKLYAKRTPIVWISKWYYYIFSLYIQWILIKSYLTYSTSTYCMEGYFSGVNCKLNCIWQNKHWQNKHWQISTQFL